MTAEEGGVVGLVCAAVAELPTSTVERIAASLENMTQPTPLERLRLLEEVGGTNARDHAAWLFATLVKQDGVEAKALALALRAAVATRESVLGRQSITTVWTGPPSRAIAVRRSHEVLLELIDAARSRIVIVSFAAYKVDSVLAALTFAVERGVDVRLVLETRLDSSGRLSQDARDAFKTLPATVGFYIWPLERRKEAGAVLHAKAALVDGDLALVTSANLTGRAMEQNLELGVLVRGGSLPNDLLRHFDELADSGELQRVS